MIRDSVYTVKMLLDFYNKTISYSGEFSRESKMTNHTLSSKINKHSNDKIVLSITSLDAKAARHKIYIITSFKASFE